MKKTLFALCFLICTAVPAVPEITAETTQTAPAVQATTASSRQQQEQLTTTQRWCQAALLSASAFIGLAICEGYYEYVDQAARYTLSTWNYYVNGEEPAPDDSPTASRE